MFPGYVGVNIYSVFCTSVMKCLPALCVMYMNAVMCPIDSQGLS